MDHLALYPGGLGTRLHSVIQRIYAVDVGGQDSFTFQLLVKVNCMYL